MFRLLRLFVFNFLALLILFTLLVMLGVWHFFPEAYSWLWASGSSSFSDWFYDPNNTFTLTLRIVFGVLIFLAMWAIAANVIRTAFVIPARFFGVYDMGRFHAWLKLSPPWRPVFGVLLPLILWWRHLHFGRPPSSRPAGLVETIYNVHKPGDIPVGIFAPANIRAFTPISVKGERMVCLVAPPGSGKTVHIITLIQQEKGNVLVFDVDGQIIHAVGQSLVDKGKKVIKLDPFNLAPGFPGASINFIEELTACEKRHGRDAVVGFAKVMADALIQKTAGVNEWVYTGGREFMKGLLLFVWLYEPEERRNMVRLRELLMRGLPEKARPEEDPFNVLLWEMLQTGDFGGVIAGAAQSMLDHQPKGSTGGKNAPLSTLRDQTAWLDLPEMVAMSQHSDFHCEDLKMGNICVFIVAPLTDLQKQFSGWARVMAEMTTYAFQRITDFRPEHPMLFIAEELASLGKLEVLETAVPGFRKFGMKVVAVLQDLVKIKEVYPHTWEMFLGSAECVVWMKTADMTTLEYLGKKLGRISRTEKIKGGWFSRLGARLQQEERPVHEYTELEGFLDQNIIVTRANQRAFFLKPLRYYDQLPVWAYQPDRFYGETPVRAWVRRLVPWITKAREKIAVLAALPFEKIEKFYERLSDKAFNGYTSTATLQTIGSGVVCALLAYLYFLANPEKIDRSYAPNPIPAFVKVILGVIGGLVALPVFYTFWRTVFRVAWSIVTGNFQIKFDGKHPDGAAPMLKVLFTKLLPLALPLVWIGSLDDKKHQASAASKGFDWPVMNSLSDIMSLAGDVLVGLFSLVIASPIFIILIWFFLWMMMFVFFTMYWTAIATAFSILPLLSRICIAILVPPLYVLRLLKQLYNWLMDKAVWHAACSTKYLPTKQKSIIRWLAKHYPERFQKAALKARRAVAPRPVPQQRLGV